MRFIPKHFLAPHGARTRNTLRIGFVFGLAFLAWVNRHSPSVQIERRVKFARQVQASLTSAGESTLALDEEKPEPAMRLHNLRLNERDSRLASQSLLDTSVLDFKALGFRSVQVTNGEQLWAFPVR